MPELTEHVEYLSQQIGPRPAGTEEEQQAALYITEQMQKEAGLSAVIEDFNSASDDDMPRAICAGITFLFVLLSIFLPVMGIPALIVTLITAALFVAEAFDYPVISRLLARGVSQNVVTKYEPGSLPEAAGTRRRKVILVAHYDSGKVRAELNGPLLLGLPYANWATLGGMAAAPLLLLFRTVFFPYAVGGPEVFFNVLSVIILILVAIPVILFVLHKLAAFNEGANCNASAVAVMLEVARRIGKGRMSEADIAQMEEATIHGEDEAREAGLVPDGVRIVYDTPTTTAFEPANAPAGDDLTSAKAAIAALTGQPVSGVTAEDISKNLVQVKEPPIKVPTEEDLVEQRDEMRAGFAALSQPAIEVVGGAAAEASSEAMQAAAPVADVAVAAAAAVTEAAQVAQPVAANQAAADVPDWFKKAQERAKKPKKDNTPVQRSRYALALDTAVAESANHFAEANEALRKEEQLAARAHQDEIHEIKAPQWSAPVEVEASAPAAAPASQAPVAYEQQPAAVEQAVPAPAEPVSQEASQPEPSIGSTQAFKPLDVNDLSLEELPPLGDVPMPAFLDPRITQREALEARAEDGPRTANRLDMTEAGVNTTGRVELSQAKVEQASQQAPGQEPAAATVASAQAADAVPQETQATPEVHRAQRPITLPDIGTTASHAPIAEMRQQRAPLANVSEGSGKTAAKSLLNMLPAIDLEAPAFEQSEEAKAEAAESSHHSPLLTSLPSLSGSISRQGAAANSSVSMQGSFGAAGATGAFAPVGDELIEDVAPEDLYIEDADDSAYEENFTETGAFAGPGYVEMPKSRVARLFDRFRRKGKNSADESSAAEWLDVDDSFDAREVGRERGGWESFRDEQDGAQDQAVQADELGATTAFAPYGEGYAVDEGESDVYDAYDGQQATPYFDGAAAYGNGAQSEDAFDAFDADDVEEDFKPTKRGRWQGGAFSRLSLGRADTASGQAEGEAEQEEHRGGGLMGAFDAVRATVGNMGADRAEKAARPERHSHHQQAHEPANPNELQQIYQFRNPDINTEVWMVALGSELSNHGGMRAFIEEHRQELRGAIIIDLDAMGAGNLTMIEQEGRYRKAKTSSRMKRYLKKVTKTTGMSVDYGNLLWEDSSASFAIKQGLQAMHLVGMDGQKPALYGSADDVLENIDERVMEENVEFVMELIKTI